MLQVSHDGDCYPTTQAITYCLFSRKLLLSRKLSFGAVRTQSFTLRHGIHFVSSSDLTAMLNTHPKFTLKYFIIGLYIKNKDSIVFRNVFLLTSVSQNLFHSLIFKCCQFFPRISSFILCLLVIQLYDLPNIILIHFPTILHYTSCSLRYNLSSGANREHYFALTGFHNSVFQHKGACPF